MNIHVNSFVKRQTSDSRFSYFIGTWEELAYMAEEYLENAKPGYREGVILVPVPPRGFADEAHADPSSVLTGSLQNNTIPAFYSGVRLLAEDDALVGKFEARREGEGPRKVVTAIGAYNKMPARSVDLVLYSSIVLAEDGSNELPPEEGNWEIISVNANPFDGEMPIAPDTLMHNHFGSSGGTKTHLSDEEFVEMLRVSFDFWKDKVLCG